MIFSSLEFLFLFLPIVLLVYAIIKPKYANAWLLLTSIFFYYKGAKEYLKLLLLVIILAYLAGIIIGNMRNEKAKKWLMRGTVLTMLVIMGYYKYWDFMIENINMVLHTEYSIRNIILPIGISFFTFQAISYIVDVTRGEKYLKNPIDMGLYIAFFPQLIAGPIVRFQDIRQYLSEGKRKINIDMLSDGVWRFTIGLCKKIIIANNLGGLVNIVFGVRDISEFSVMYTWLGAIAYALQIYYDFSGYSDMAIGLGKVFGFEFQENFNYPYIASSIKDFWRRWHISLSQFFRDYVYIPLGGNRCKLFRWMVNTMLVWFLTGIWHGASWTYVAWGMAYGVLIIIETLLFKENMHGKIFSIIKRIYTLLVISVLWVVFRADSLQQAGIYIKNMFGITANGFIDNAFLYQVKNFSVLIIIALIFCTPVTSWVKEKTDNCGAYRVVSTVALMLGFIACISYMYMGSYNPFLYFMF